MSGEALSCFINNTFFFFSIVIVTTVQCFDEIQTLLSSLRTQKKLRSINEELQEYTGGLESLVKERMAEQEESDLKFRDLYNNILDLVVLINDRGIIQMINHHGAQLLELSAQALKNRPLTDFLPPQDQDILTRKILVKLARGRQVQGMQMRLLTYQGRLLDVELSGNSVTMPEQQLCYQLIIRDITLTKQIEKQVLESKQLLDTSVRRQSLAWPAWLSAATRIPGPISSVSAPTPASLPQNWPSPLMHQPLSRRPSLKTSASPLCCMTSAKSAFRIPSFSNLHV